MSIQKLKSTYSVGAYIKKIAEIWNKVNEIIDNLNGTGAAGSGSYKKYVAILSQSGTNPPVAIVLENTLGATVSYNYAGAGLYYGELSASVLTEGKTVIFIGNEADVSTRAYRNDADTFQIDTLDTSLVTANNMLFTTALEIRVYN